MAAGALASDWWIRRRSPLIGPFARTHNAPRGGETSEGRDAREGIFFFFLDLGGIFEFLFFLVFAFFSTSGVYDFFLLGWSYGLLNDSFSFIMMRREAVCITKGFFFFNHSFMEEGVAPQTSYIYKTPPYSPLHFVPTETLSITNKPKTLSAIRK